MSRIGKQPIQIPADVKVEIIEGPVPAGRGSPNSIGRQEIKVSGPLGNLAQTINPEIKIEVKDGQILLSPKKEDYLKKTGALWGLFRAIVANMITGVTKGFEKKLDIEGIGYKASVEGNDLSLSVGFTLPVKVKCPEGVKFAVEKNLIFVTGSDRAKVGQIAAIIRKVKKAEPYKGKGLRYFDEVIRRKEGKKVVATKK
ncbi:50S ribosomal protein L6 [Patescibacteria group bacterium]|nr:50S ribosomal protein L6 [Patescibacteria group bacterium]